MAKYDIVPFEDLHDNEYVDIQDLETFIEDAEIVIVNFGMAYSKSSITSVGDSLRGAVLDLKDGTIIYGYDVQSKLVPRKRHERSK